MQIINAKTFLSFERFFPLYLTVVWPTIPDCTSIHLSLARVSVVERWLTSFANVPLKQRLRQTNVSLFLPLSRIRHIYISNQNASCSPRYLVGESYCLVRVSCFS